MCARNWVIGKELDVVSSRRGRQSRQGQKFTAAPSDLRTKGRSGPVRRVISIESGAAAWPCAEDLAVLPEDELALVLVQLEGRRITGAELVSCYHWLFGNNSN